MVYFISTVTYKNGQKIHSWRLSKRFWFKSRLWVMTILHNEIINDLGVTKDDCSIIAFSKV